MTLKKQKCLFGNKVVINFLFYLTKIDKKKRKPFDFLFFLKK